VLTNPRRTNGLWLNELPALGPALKPLLPELIAGTRSTRPVVRRYSFEALGLLGADAKDAIPALQEAIKAKLNGNQPDVALKKIEAALNR
jgi:hypothetical protein